MADSAKRGASRSSLACLPCRSRHLKCDGNKPICRRCTESDAAQECSYAKSRRGGLDRAALAERRKRLTGGAEKPDRDQDVNYNVNAPLPPETFNVDFSGSANGASSTNSNSSSPINFLAEVQSIEGDLLVESYYRNFHKFHPLVPPQRCLARLYQDPERQAVLKPLIAVLRLIGHIYSAKQWPAQADQVVETYLSQAPPQNPFIVQCRLLYSIALFWYDDKIGSAKQKTTAGQLSVDLGMHRREYALEHGEGDAVLAESWRRTWWWNYIIEAYYLGTLGTLEFAVLRIEASVDLPCEEDEYESGVSVFLRCLADADVLRRVYQSQGPRKIMTTASS